MKLLFVTLSAMLAVACTQKSVETPIETVVDNALKNAEQQALAMAAKYAPQEGLLPKTWQEGKDVSSDSRWWCSGFFPGTLWLLYENSGNAQTLDYARQFTDRVEREKFTTDNHDVGFILMCSFGNGLRITGEERYKEVLATGAGSLATRFRDTPGLIRSWDFNRDKWQFPVIIDNMMNLELMMWAADYTGDENLRRIAISHADKTIENHFREDFSTWHVVSYDTLSGRPHARQTHQGFGDESTWSRGEAWALYGYTMMYRLTRDERYLRQAQSVAGFILNHPNMPVDGVPYWDFNAPDVPNALRDSSAAAIMASAFVELAGFSEPELADSYIKMAETQVRTLASPEYTAVAGENGDFILKHGVGAVPFNVEVDVPLTYGDYYYVEALTRLKARSNKR
jgi:hypothetical protein